MKEEKKGRQTLNSKMKLLYVMVVIFIVCGGNGVGILTGAVIWRTTQRTALAIAVALAVTLAAIGAAVCLLLACRRAAASDGEERKQPVIPED